MARGGVLPNGTAPDANSTEPEQQLFFWFFPTENGDATDEVTIWLNGGVSGSEFIPVADSPGLSGMSVDHGVLTTVDIARSFKHQRRLWRERADSVEARQFQAGEEPVGA